MKRVLLIALFLPLSAFAGGKIKPAPPVKPAPSSAPELFKIIESPNSTLKDVQDFLKTHKVYLADETENGRNLLYSALSLRKNDIFAELDRYFGNPDPNYFNPKHDANSRYSIYSTAITFADWATILDLRARGGSLAKNPFLDPGITELMMASAFNSLDVVQHLFAEAGDVRRTDKASRTLLMYAAQNTIDVLRYILSQGADVRTKDQNDMTALLYAGCQPGVIHALIAAGSDLGQVSLDRTTALQRIAACDDDQDFGAALAAIPNADVNFQDTQGRTALYMAAAGNSITVTKQLLLYNANVNLADREGKTPLMMAAEYGTDPEVMKAIIKAGADLNLVSKGHYTKWTALMYAAGANENPEFTRVLAAAGADLNYQATDSTGDLDQTAMMAAAFLNHEENLIVLLDAGADKYIATKYGNRAYDYALGAKMSQSTLNRLK